jgi:hypothetical protein
MDERRSPIRIRQRAITPAGVMRVAICPVFKALGRGNEKHLPRPRVIAHRQL